MPAIRLLILPAATAVEHERHQRDREQHRERDSKHDRRNAVPAEPARAESVGGPEDAKHGDDRADAYQGIVDDPLHRSIPRGSRSMWGHAPRNQPQGTQRWAQPRPGAGGYGFPE